MSEPTAANVQVGDEVRVHFHPPIPAKSFIEGMVTRVDETFPHGPLVVVDVTHQVILGRDAPLRLGHQEYILSECWKDFSGQIEVLTTSDQRHNLMGSPYTTAHANDAVMEEAIASVEPVQKNSENHEVHRHGGFIAALFGRAR